MSHLSISSKWFWTLISTISFCINGKGGNNNNIEMDINSEEANTEAEMVIAKNMPEGSIPLFQIEKK